MARYTGPTTKIARKFGEPIYGPDKVLQKKNYAPGQHGPSKRRGKKSVYGSQLLEKQKAKFTYGVLEKQFANLFKEAYRRPGITGEILLQLLEQRLDNVVFRMGIAPTRRAARQLITHKHITLNDEVVNIPSALVKPGDIIYTKSPTGEFPYGIIKQSKINYNVIVSPLYGVFSPKTKALGAMLDSYFSSKANTRNYLHPIIQKGAKNTINITNETFLSHGIALPTDNKEEEALVTIIETINRY